MQFTPPLIKALLIKRYKRFLADVMVFNDEGMLISATAHCPNTGSMKNCQAPQAEIWCSRSDNPKRKYPLTWELIKMPRVTSRENCSDIFFDFIGINTHRANALVKEAIENKVIDELQGYSDIKREVWDGKKHRLDFMLQGAGQRICYVEVKSVTLLYGDGGVGLFPDAITARGTRHLQVLMERVRQGDRAVLFFCVQHSGVMSVAPEKVIDPVYARTLVQACQHGVEILAYKAQITPEAIALTHSLPVDLS